jgi:gas vesicle protein
VSSRGFWNGVITGGLIGAAVAFMYLSPESEDPSVEPKIKRVIGKLGRARQAAEDFGSGVAGAWKK